MVLEKKIVGLSVGALDRFVSRARRIVGLRGRVNILVTSSANMRSLNYRFRQQNKATDVLSFPADSWAAKRSKSDLAGEVAISGEIAVQNAVRLGHPPATEIKILALHGILHLAGFDHERDNGRMAREEAKLRRTLHLPESLIERTETPVESPLKRRHYKWRLGRARRTA